jgi:hypothetical protein
MRRTIIAAALMLIAAAIWAERERLELAVLGRDIGIGAPFVLMPEAAMHKEHRSVAREHQVRCSRKPFLV